MQGRIAQGSIMSDESLNAFARSYEQDYKHSLDASLMSYWYRRRVAELARGQSLLELGIGHGKTVHFFSNVFARHLVVEGSKAVIDNFFKSFPDAGCEVVHGFFEDFNTEERFDHMSLGFVMEHVDDPVGLLKRFSRFVSSTGSIFISVPNATSLHRRFGHAAGLLDDMKTLSREDHKLGHKRFYDQTSLERDIERAGLRILRAEGIFLKPLTTSQIEQLKLPASILEAFLTVGRDYPELCNALFVEVQMA